MLTDSDRRCTSESVHSYTPESRLRRSSELLRRIWADLLRSRELSAQLFIRDLKSQYRNSFLGGAWLLIPTIIMAVGCSCAADLKIIALPSSSIPYFAYTILSLSLWQTFVEALTAPIQAVQQYSSTFTKIVFPYESIILAKVYEVALNFAFKLPWRQENTSTASVFVFPLDAIEAYMSLSGLH